jgi:predicted nucleic acid-binding protein
MSNAISRRVVDASPLIFLTEVGLLEILHQQGVDVLVPDTVLNEIGALRPPDPAAEAVRQSSWIQIVPTPRIPGSVLVWDLDAGESAVLAVALERPDSMVILDDQPARRCAQVLGIPTQGTLGLVLVAKKRGFVPRVGPVLAQLKAFGMYMSSRLEQQILVAAGESSP